MSAARVRIAVASTPPTASLDEALPPVLAAIAEAGRLGARIVCFAEAVLPGHRLQARAVEPVSAQAMAAALERVAAAARAAGVVTLVGIEQPTAAGRGLAQVVFDGDGKRIGEQAKTQMDPSEETIYVAGTGRRVFAAAGLTFGIAICHEIFRYPEITRSLVLAGAQVVFAPQYVTTVDGSLPSGWLDPRAPYNEKALLCRAMENTVFVAAANVAGPSQGSFSGIIGPDGSLLTSVPYGRTGVAVAELELDLATRLIARRWAPERSLLS
jgi:predicted amidohydrolase